MWTGAGPIRSDSAVLPGLQILVEDREPAVADLIRPQASATPPAAQVAATPAAENVCQGSSDDVIGPLDLVPGLYQVSARYAGDDKFVVWAHQADGASDLLVNEIGSYAGEATFTVESAGKVVLEVVGIGAWELRIEKLM